MAKKIRRAGSRPAILVVVCFGLLLGANEWPWRGTRHGMARRGTYTRHMKTRRTTLYIHLTQLTHDTCCRMTHDARHMTWRGAAPGPGGPAEEPEAGRPQVPHLHAGK